MEKKLNSETKKDRNDNELTLIIIVPAQPEPWEATFSKTAKISDVIQAVIEKFGFATNGKYELKLEKDPNITLEPQRPLVSYKIEDGDKIVFIDFGQAV